MITLQLDSLTHAETFVRRDIRTSRKVLRRLKLCVHVVWISAVLGVAAKEGFHLLEAWEKADRIELSVGTAGLADALRSLTEELGELLRSSDSE